MRTTARRLFRFGACAVALATLLAGAAQSTPASPAASAPQVAMPPRRPALPKVPPIPPEPAAPTAAKVAAPDISGPPPMLPRASRERMRACADEWGEKKRTTRIGLPMWRDFATECLTR